MKLYIHQNNHATKQFVSEKKRQAQHIFNWYEKDKLRIITSQRGTFLPYHKTHLFSYKNDSMPFYIYIACSML